MGDKVTKVTVSGHVFPKTRSGYEPCERCGISWDDWEGDVCKARRAETADGDANAYDKGGRNVPVG
jgi:hypothetical protein